LRPLRYLAFNRNRSVVVRQCLPDPSTISASCYRATFFLRDLDVHTLDRIVQYSVVRTVSSLHWNVREVPILLQKSFCTAD